MRQYLYPAIVEKTQDGFSVYFPDIDGCTSAGPSIDHALENSKHALQSHIESLREHEEKINKPSKLQSVKGSLDEIYRGLVTVRY